ncbi:uncharacterized protein [Nicotiana sylvestris]|uniref:uncharacterized protein n=1 Tax=Nicotiana sylvestris TaxID=4096 RepID=UPI00388CA04B
MAPDDRSHTHDDYQGLPNVDGFEECPDAPQRVLSQLGRYQVVPEDEDLNTQAQEVEGERRRLAKENEALRAQIQKMKKAAENPIKSERDEKLINKLRLKVCDYGFDLEKTEAELAKARAKLAKNAEGRASFVRQLKEKYDKGMVGLKKKVNVLENEMTKQERDFKAEREHCYSLMSRLEKDMQQLQEQNHTTKEVF